MKFIYSKKIVDFKKNLFSKIKLLNGKRKAVFKKTYQFIQKKPFTSFFAVLGVFLILMIIGNVLFGF